MECDEGDVVGLDPLVERTIRQHLGVHTILVQLLMNHKQKKNKKRRRRRRRKSKKHKYVHMYPV